MQREGTALSLGASGRRLALCLRLGLATLRVPWLATATTVCALAVLMALTVVQLAARSRERRQEGPVAAPVERDYFALACAKVQDDFGLTAREMDVFGLLARGRTSAYIQKALSISDGTARTHIPTSTKSSGSSPSRLFSTSWRRRWPSWRGRRVPTCYKTGALRRAVGGSERVGEFHSGIVCI